jgi:hypothetical protein
LKTGPGFPARKERRGHRENPVQQALKETLGLKVIKEIRERKVFKAFRERQVRKDLQARLGRREQQEQRVQADLKGTQERPGPG